MTDSDKNSYDGELSDEDSDEALNGRLTVGAAAFGFTGEGVQNLGHYR